MEYPSGDVVELFDAGGELGTNSDCRCLFVIDDFQVFNHDSIADSVGAVIPYAAGEVPPVELREGVPGCGKTWELVRAYRPGGLVLCACRSTADEIRKEMTRMEILTEKVAVRRVRTLDSFLMRADDVEDVLECLIDEALMVHAGAVYAALRKSKARSATIYGDRVQIPFINRVKQFRCAVNVMNRFIRETMNYDSRRCPVDAVAAVYEVYGGKMRTYSTKTDSLSFMQISSVNDVPKQANTVYLTMRKDERATLIAKGFCKPGDVMCKTDAMTVHSAQGRTIKHVIFVRLFPQKSTIFDSMAHCVVGLTRHTDSFKYCSVRSDDLMCGLIEKGKRVALYSQVQIAD